MAGPQEIQRRQQEQQQERYQMTATDQLNAQRFDREYELQTPREIEVAHQHHAQQLLARRRELYDMGLKPDMNLVVAPQQAPQRVPPVSQLSDRQRRKIADKRMNNLKKAQKKNLVGATEDTLPMLEAVKKASKEYTRHPPTGDDLYTYNLDARLFSPDFPEEKECSIDVEKGLKTLAKLRLSVQKYRTDVRRHTQEANVAMKANERLIAPLEIALRTVLAANGVDMKTGAPITNPALVEQARILRAAAIRSYEKAVADIPQMLQEEAENYLAHDLEIEEREIERNDDEHRAEETMDLDFVFHYQPLEAEYVQLRGTIDAHPAEYAAHQAVVDQCYQRYLDANRQIAAYGRRILALNNQAGGRVAEGRVRGWLRDRATQLQQSPELENLQTLAAQQREMIRYLVEGRPFSEPFTYLYKVLADEYGIQTEARQQEQQEHDLVMGMTRGQKRVYDGIPMEQRQQAVRVVRELHQTIEEKEASLDHLRELIKGSKMDLRALKIFWNGHRVNEHGEPVDAQQQAKRDADEAFTRAYLTNDPALTVPLLQPVIQQMLDFPSRYQDWEKAFWEHPGEMYEAVTRNVYFQHVIEDHPEVFSTMPKEVMEKLDQSMQLGANISTMMIAIAYTRGIHFNLGEWADDQDAVEGGKMQEEVTRQVVNQMLKQMQA